MEDVLSVIVIATLWCTLHSLLITHACERWIERVCGPKAAWYRVVYNLFSGATLLWCWLEFRQRPGDTLWAWHGLWQVPRLAGLAVAAWLGWLGVRAHDNEVFLGLRQVRDMRRGRKSEPPVLMREGALGMVRHPYYAAGLLAVALFDDFRDNIHIHL